jgi:hypothetical protein
LVQLESGYFITLTQMLLHRDGEQLALAYIPDTPG